MIIVNSTVKPYMRKNRMCRNIISVLFRINKQSIHASVDGL